MIKHKFRNLFKTLTLYVRITLSTFTANINMKFQVTLIVFLVKTIFIETGECRSYLQKAGRLGSNLVPSNMQNGSTTSNYDVDKKISHADIEIPTTTTTEVPKQVFEEAEDSSAYASDNNETKSDENNLDDNYQFPDRRAYFENENEIHIRKNGFGSGGEVRTKDSENDTSGRN